MADSWDVIYRATADFGDLLRATAQARDELKRTAEEAKKEGDTEAEAAAKAAAAHDADTEAIKRQKKALEELAIAAKAANTAQGTDRSSSQRLQDLDRERIAQEFLNRSRQRGFATPQQALSFQAQERTSADQMNRSLWGGYTSREQFIQSLAKERQAQEALNTSWAGRAALLRASADAASSHTDAMAGLSGASAQALADTTKNVGALNDVVGGIPTDVTTTVHLDKTEAVASIDDVKARLRDLSRQVADPEVKLSSADFTAKLLAIKAQWDAFLKSSSAGKLGISSEGTSDVNTMFRQLSQQGIMAFSDLEHKGSESATTLSARWKQVGMDIGATWFSLRSSAQAAAADVTGVWAKAAAGIKAAMGVMSSGGAGGGGGAGMAQGLLDFGAAAGSTVAAIGPLGAAIIAIIQLLPALSAGLGAVAAVFASVPDLIFAAAGAFVIFHSAIQPVMQALTAYSGLLNAQQAASANSAQTSMELAQQAHAVSDAYAQVAQAAFQATQAQVQNAHAVADAQFALGQAIQQSTTTQLSDAHAVADAQFSLKEAYFQAGIQQMQSAMSVADAMHNLQDANFQVSQSQFQLNMAWQTAQRDLQDLEIQVGMASLNLRGAQLNLEQAQQQYAQTMANSTATALERAQAAYQVQVAEQALAQVTLQNTRNSQDLANVQKYGVAQYYGVTQAQHALTDAQFAQIQAQKNLIIVQKEAANQQIVAAHSIKDAVFSLMMAERQRSNDALTSAHNISDAQFALSQAQTNQAQSFITNRQAMYDAQFALNQALATQALGLPAIASAQAQLNTALSQLGPYAATAVKYLEQLWAWWNNNTSAQDAFFRQVDPELKGISGLIKPINYFLDALATSAGKVAAAFLGWFEQLATSPLWKVLTQTSANIIFQLGMALLNVAKAFVEIAQAAAPFTNWFVTWIKGLSQQFLDWATNMAKPGSALRTWLNDAMKLLPQLVQLLMSAVYFFEILAGGSPKFNNKGVLVGVIPDAAQQNNFKEFLKVLADLSNTLLPTLALILQKLSSPAMVNALLNLVNALAQLLLAIVSSPGFQQSFTTFVSGFTTFVDLLSTLAGLPVVGNILGTIAGALVIIAGLKFTGVLALLSALGKVKVGGLPGAAASAEAGAAGSGVAGTAERTGAAAGGAAAGARVFSASDLAAPILELGIPILAVDAIFHKSIASWWNGPAGFFTLFVKPFDGFFKSIPQYLSDQTWKHWFDVGNSFFVNDLMNPFNHFFSIQFPNWLGNTNNGWSGLWANTQSSFRKDLLDPLGRFFSSDIPGWLGISKQTWDQNWSGAWGFFMNVVVTPMKDLFTGNIPGLFKQMGQDFVQYVGTPLGSFFQKVLPTSIQNAFKSSVDFVVTGLNKAIGFINTDILGHLPGGLKVSTIPLPFAVGGSVPTGSGSVGGSGDHDSVDALLTPGEFVVRKAARMALDSAYGPGFLETINHADKVIVQQRFAGGGSVGSTQNFIDSVKTHPYVWGGVGPGGYDCSGLTGEVYARLLGLPSFRRYFVTQSFGSNQQAAALGFLPGLGEYTVGVDPATHMVGNLGGLKFEARDTQDGIIVGPNATDVRAMQKQFHLSRLGGGFSAAGGSLLSNLGHFLGGLLNDVTSPVKHLLSGLFDAGWKVGVQPLINAVTGPMAGTIPGVAIQAGSADIKSAIDKKLLSIDTSAIAPGGNPRAVPAPKGTGVGVEEAYARSLMSSYGWGTNQMSGLIPLWMGESGWNPWAVNPGSGAAGIPQALGHGHVFNLGDWAAQIRWGLNYIKGRYGSPNAAYSAWLSRSPHWYAKGGPVRLREGGDHDHDRDDDDDDDGGGGGTGGGPPPLGSLTPAQQYAIDLAALTTGMGAVDTAWGKLSGVSPNITNSKQQTDFQNSMSALTNLQSGFDNAWSSVNALDPGSISDATWAALSAAYTSLDAGETSGTGLGAGWSLVKKDASSELTAARNALVKIPPLSKKAQADWDAIYGGSGRTFPPTPGVSSGLTFTGPGGIDLASLLAAGPAKPFFAGGGSVGPSRFGGDDPFAALANLGSIAAFTYRVSSFPGSGMPHKPGSGVPDRQLSPAGQTGAGGGFNVGAINIHNPIREAAGESVTRAVNRLALLAGRGIA